MKEQLTTEYIQKADALCYCIDNLFMSIPVKDGHMEEFERFQLVFYSMWDNIKQALDCAEN